MHRQVLRERVGLASLPRVLMPIRPVVPLHERRVDGRARRRSLQSSNQQAEHAEDQGPHHLHDVAFLAPLPHGRIALLGRDDLHGLGRSARPRTLRPGLLHAVDLGDRRLVWGVLVAGDQQVGPPSGPIPDLTDQALAGLAVALARHQGQEQSALGVDGGMIPIIATEPIERVEGIARSLLLGDEVPLLVDLDFTGSGGEGPRVRHGASRRGPRRAPGSASPCSCPHRPGDSWLASRSLPGCASGWRGLCRRESGRVQGRSPCAQRRNACRCVSRPSESAGPRRSNHGSRGFSRLGRRPRGNGNSDSRSARWGSCWPALLVRIE
jgi:hypothetical protein